MNRQPVVKVPQDDELYRSDMHVPLHPLAIIAFLTNICNLLAAFLQPVTKPPAKGGSRHPVQSHSRTACSAKNVTS